MVYHRWGFSALLHVLEYILRAQEVYDEAVACRYRPLPEIYLIRMKAENVDIEPRFLPAAPDRFKT